MKSKLIKAAIISLPLFLLTGCIDGEEPETLGYVVAIGIDKTENNEKGYNITLQFANPAKISGGSNEEGGKGGEDSIENITVAAPGIYSAVNIANHIISKKFVLSHTKLIVFSEDVAKEGITDFIGTIGRSGDIRPNTYFAVSKGKASEFLGAVNPETEVNPVRYYTMIFENDYSGFIPQNMSEDFYFFYNSEEKSTVMPVCAVSGEENDTKYSNTGYQEGMEDYRAGEIPSEKEETQVMGMAIFDGDKQVGEMGDIETEMYNMLTGEYKSSYVVYYYSKTPDEPVTVIQQQKKKPNIKVDTSGDTPKIKAEIFIESDFTSTAPKESVEDHLEEFTNEVTEEIKQEAEQFIKKTQKMGTDIVGFGSFAKRNFATLNKFTEYKWKEKYKNAEIEVHVNFDVRRTGLIVRSEKD